MVLPSRNGHFFSMAQPDYCLCVSNVDIGLLELSKCDDQVKLEYTNDGFFELIGSADKYMDFLDENDMYNNEIKMNLKAFSEALGYPCCSDLDDIIEKIMNGISILGSKTTFVSFTSTISTETYSYYLYNSASNTCEHSSGILDSLNCISLWRLHYLFSMRSSLYI
ncbi:hypothetical protein H8356DRAFT_1340766 [Neocallimastix lanati (nom. inval.)]|nr:hypothetical protein H8356DRAFT_1340766 [Neocallimastix sp. JGI-2020a]